MQPSAPATNSAQALNNLQSYAGSMKSPEADLQEQQQNLGVTAAQGQVSGLRGAIANTTSLLNQVAPSVMGRTANSLVTSAQADQQIGNEQAPLNTQLNTENTQYSNANQDYTNLEQRAESLANADETGQQNQESYLQNIYNNLYTQEQNSAASAEQKRMDDASIASQSAAANGVSSPSLASLGGTTSGSTAAAVAPPPDFAKTVAPQDAISQLFKGYQPAVDKNYTEQVILPSIERLLALQNPQEPQQGIVNAANNMVYTYRKQNFGE